MDRDNVYSSATNVVREIFVLREKTDAAVAANREEAARLEEVNQEKQSRILALEREIASLMGDQSPVGCVKRSTSALKLSSSSSTPARRWSLSKLRTPSEGDLDRERRDKGRKSSNGTPLRRRLSWKSEIKAEQDMDLDPARGESGTKSPNGTPLRRQLSWKGGIRAEQKLEGDIMQYLSGFERQTKALVDQRHAELRFQQDQVEALEMTARSQEQEIATLREKLTMIRDQSIPKRINASEPEISEDIIRSLRTRLADYIEKANELESELRFLKKIEVMDEAETDECMASLRAEISESRLRLQSSEAELEANRELLGTELEARIKELRRVEIEIGLLESVNRTIIRRLEKKVRKGGEDLPGKMQSILDRGILAIEEELNARVDIQEERDISNLESETERVASLVAASIQCADAITQTISTLLSKNLPIEAVDVFKNILKELHSTVSVCVELSTELEARLRNKESMYRIDDTLLPNHIVQQGQQDYAEKENSKVVSGACVNDRMNIGKQPSAEIIGHENERTCIVEQLDGNDWEANLVDLQESLEYKRKLWDERDKELTRKLQEIEQLKLRNAQLQAELNDR